MKFFKIAALWMSVFVATIAFGEWSASIGLEWVASILAASLFGHFLMLVTTFVITVLCGKGINTSAWWTVGLFVLSFSFTKLQPQDFLYVGGIFLGIVLSYWLLRKSGEMLSRQPTATT